MYRSSKSCFGGLALHVYIQRHTYYMVVYIYIQIYVYFLQLYIYIYFFFMSHCQIHGLIGHAYM